jgi:hypothetical protein
MAEMVVSFDVCSGCWNIPKFSWLVVEFDGWSLGKRLAGMTERSKWALVHSTECHF